VAPPLGGGGGAGGGGGGGAGGGGAASSTTTAAARIIPPPRRPQRRRPAAHVIAHLVPQLDADGQFTGGQVRGQADQEAAEPAPHVRGRHARRGAPLPPRPLKGFRVQRRPGRVARRVGQVGVVPVVQRVGVGAGAVEALARVAGGALLFLKMEENVRLRCAQERDETES